MAVPIPPAMARDRTWQTHPEAHMPAAHAIHAPLLATLPRLRAQAMALTRNRAAAEDLVQDAVANALAAQDSFTPGTNFAAWMHRILYNRFLSTLRKQRETLDIDELPAGALASPATHEDRLVLHELARGLHRLPAEWRAALLLVVVQGLSYEAAAEALGCAVGTAKSRVFRARRQLQQWLLGEVDTVPPALSGQRADGAAEPPTVPSPP